jgi:SAM-dependent methyltransferase
MVVPYPLNPSFSLVTAFSLIEHIREDNKEKFYEEVKKVLVDNGISIMHLANRYFPIEQHTFIPLLGYFPLRFHFTFFHDYVSVPSKDKTIE